MSLLVLLTLLAAVRSQYPTVSSSVTILPQTCHEVQISPNRGWQLSSNVTSSPSFTCQSVDLDLDRQIMIQVDCDGVVYYQSYKNYFQYNYYGGCSKLTVFYTNNYKKTIMQLDVSVVEQSYYRQPSYCNEVPPMIFLLLIIIGAIVTNRLLQDSTKEEANDQKV